MTLTFEDFAHIAPVGVLVELVDDMVYDIVRRELVRVDGPMIAVSRVIASSGFPTVRFLSRCGILHLWNTKVRWTT